MKNVEQREKFKILAQIRKNVSGKQWKCIEPDCGRMAINSHLLQRNGILSNITDNGHLYEIKSSDIHRWHSRSQLFEFKKLGISKALAQPLFCEICDSKIFESIEKGHVSLDSYLAFGLLNYRVACAEQRKKEIEIEVFQRILNSKTLRGRLDTVIIEQFLYGYELGVRDLTMLRDLIRNEIKYERRVFSFEKFSYPLVKVYGAALFGTTDENSNEVSEKIEFDDIFIHVIPLESSLLIMCGYLNEFKTKWAVDFVDSWRDLNEDDLQLNLTNLFAARIENWGIAPSLFESIPKETIDKMINFWNENAGTLDKSLESDFNLFE